MVQLHHVRYFTATVDEGSVSGAARRLHVTQPGLSRQLRQLEAELGVPLFDRDAGRLVLTRSGAALLPVARQLLEAADLLQAGADLLRTGHVERLRIAAPTVTLTDVVAPFVATTRPDEPVVDVVPSDGVPASEALRAGADLVISGRALPTAIRSRVLAVLPVWAYVRRDDPWATRESVGLTALHDRVSILPPRGFGARDVLEAVLDSSGASLGEVVEAANGTVAQALAASGRGVALVSDDPRYDLLPLAVDVRGERLSLRLFAGWDPRNPAAPAVDALGRRLAAFVAERYGTAQQERGTPRPG
jgi:LysR family transcriptional regulator, benzoate and cis,cis-muconate-responsive activator of ben and cat genes